MTNEQKALEAESWRTWNTEAWGNTISGAHAWGWEHGYEEGLKAGRAARLEAQGDPLEYVAD